MLVLNKLSLVESVEVTIKCLGDDRIYNGFGCLRASTQLEGLVYLLVCGLKLKLLRLIVCNT